MGYTWTISNPTPAAVSSIFPSGVVISITTPPDPSSTFTWTASGSKQMTLTYTNSTFTYSGSATLGSYSWSFTITLSGGTGSTWNASLTGTSLTDGTTVTGSFVAQASTSGPPGPPGKDHSMDSRGRG